MLKKIAAVHHNILEHRGGGDLVCAWILESLKDDYELSYITWGKKIAIEEVNEYYGTNIKMQNLKIYYHPILTKLHLQNRPYHFILAMFEIYVKKFRDEFDLFISTYNEFDFGKRGIQYIHGPSRSEYAAQLYLITYKETLLRKIYHKLCDSISGFNLGRTKRNITLVNSNWTGKVFQDTFGLVPTITAYPPVVLKYENIPWENREDGFLCIGEVLPEKKIIESIKVINTLQALGYDVHLHIVGNGQGQYAEKVKTTAKGYPYIFFEGRLNRKEISKLINTHKYGIHMRNCEGFGIAIAEMAYGGCIPFVRKGGGQEEAVGSNSAVLFDDCSDAVSKIKYVLDNITLQRKVQSELLSWSKKFSVNEFKQKIKEIVKFALENTKIDEIE